MKEPPKKLDFGIFDRSSTGLLLEAASGDLMGLMRGDVDVCIPN